MNGDIIKARGELNSDITEEWDIFHDSVHWAFNNLSREDKWKVVDYVTNKFFRGNTVTHVVMRIFEADCKELCGFILKALGLWTEEME